MHEELRKLGITRNSTGRAICPVCSHLRKNKKDPCLQVTFKDDAVLYNCHHCHWSGVVGDKKYNLNIQPIVYKKPAQPKVLTEQERVDKYFAGRGITKDTLDSFNIGYNGREILFPYYKNSELVNVKYRTAQKTWRQEAESEKTLFGMDNCIDLVADTNDYTLVIAEGECFKGDTEVLTPNGWVRLDEYNNQHVLQVNKDMTSEFTKPLAYINKEYSGKLNYLNSRNAQIIATPGHNMVYFDKKMNLVKKPWNKMPKSVNGFIPMAVEHNGSGLNLTDNEIRLLIAISADGSLTKRKNGNTYVRESFLKERKIKRFEELLNSCGVKYSKGIHASKHTCFCFTYNKAFKLFPMEWLSKASSRQKKIILKELVFWDGNSVPNRNQDEFSTKEMHNATFVQTLCHLSGFNSTIISRENKFGKWFKVSMLYSKNSCSYQQGHDVIDYNGRVYCVTVESGMILTRTNGKITVIGNCDAMSFQQAGISGVSIPQGASDNKLDCITNCFDFISAFDNIVIAMDADEAGNKMKKVLVDRFNKSKNVYIIDWSKYDVKDANEALQRGGEELIQKAYAEKKAVPIKGIIDMRQHEENILDYMFGDYQKGASTGWSNLDRLLRMQGGCLMTITGYPSRGKSTVTNNLLYNLTEKSNWKHLICSFENTVARHVQEFTELRTGKNSRTEGTWCLKKEEALESITYLSDKFYLYDTDTPLTVDDIIEIAKYAVERYGIKTLTIDPYNRIKHPSSDREDKYIGEMLSKLSFFAKQYDVLVIFVAHPKKPPQGHVDAPTAYDISGSSDWYNMSDIVLCVHRVREEGGKLSHLTELYVQKVKGHHLGDPAGGMVNLQMHANRLVVA